jgi:hypothetical protein
MTETNKATKNDNQESLAEQRDLLRLQLQNNRLHLRERIAATNPGFPRSFTMRLLAQIPARELLTTLALSTVGARLFPSLVRGVYIARMVHQALAPTAPVAPRVERVEQTHKPE